MKEVAFNYGPFQVTAKVISGGWEGDPSVPDGVRELPTEVNEMKVFSMHDKKMEEDLYSFLDERILEKIDEALFDALL